MNAWRRLLPMLRTEKTAYIGYVLMKIVLAVGSAIIFGILNLIVLLILFLVLGVIGFVLVLAGAAVGLSWNLWTIGAAIVAGGVALSGLFFVLAFVSAPAVIFFQSYTLQFFGSRYPLLGGLLTRARPTPPAAAPALAF